MAHIIRITPVVVDSDPEPVFDAPREVVDMVVHNGRVDAKLVQSRAVARHQVNYPRLSRRSCSSPGWS